MKKKILITGGAGFIGVNLANHLLLDSDNFVVIYDNLSRKGVHNNLEWIMARDYRNLEFIKGDICDYDRLKQAVMQSDEIYHLAAQVAVTKSVEEPLYDFRANAEGSLYLLEAARKHAPAALLVYASTNKVYGELLHMNLREDATRYILSEKETGIGETENLDFHSPYGCAKGSADQYFRDYYRIYGLRTVVFRQSCIMGPFQYGNEDQGWIAHFIIKSLLGRKINIYGDGKQVRDILYVSDLINAYELALNNIEMAGGEIYNIGGGPENTFSLLELLDFLETLSGRRVEHDFSDWRPGDQKVFISDNSKLKESLGWLPRVSKQQGVVHLADWIKENIETIKKEFI